MHESGYEKSSARWAVLVGIDFYSASEPAFNLRGSCNDAMLVYDFLYRTLGVPEENILLHLARDPKFPPIVPDPPSTSPTYWNFRDSLDHVKRQASPGDFVYIHFAGHGTRRTTIHRDQKLMSDQDERLCFVDNEMTDVVFGELLDVMAAPPYNLILTVAIDCCFSGGMTRQGDYCAVRSKPSTQKTSESETRGLKVESSTSRNASVQKGWLYHDRAYNVIAASQPHEKCMEAPDPVTNQQVYGALTYSMINQLYKLGDQRSLITYELLQGVIEAALRGDFSHITQQQPMLLGPRKRILFTDMLHDQSPSNAHVKVSKPDLVVIDRGLASGSRVGDIYLVLEPAKLSELYHGGSEGANVLASSSAFVKVKIRTVREYESDGVYISLKSPMSRHQEPVECGWIATLVKRSTVAKVQVNQSDPTKSDDVLEMIRSEWENFNDPVVPMHLHFGHDYSRTVSRAGAAFIVHVDADSLRIHNSQDRHFLNLPVVLKSLFNSTADCTRRLMRLLQHMQLYHEVSEMRTSSRINRAPRPFDLNIVECEPYDNTVVSSWQIHIRSTHVQTLYFVVFNLSALHGVKQAFPNDEGNAKPLVPGGQDDTIMDIRVPEQLLPQYLCDPSFKMIDILKIFVTTEYINLRHLELPDVTAEWLASHRHATARRPGNQPPASWWVEEKRIVTKSQRAGVN
ncbi:caspase domain-containing protein [Xylariaceae sp. FL1019]|nr:caspase domain-containing protein [Xylariaceae sp. FL1019]